MNPFGIRRHHFFSQSLTDSSDNQNALERHALCLHEGKDLAITAIESLAKRGKTGAIEILFRFVQTNPESPLTPLVQQSIENLVDEMSIDQIFIALDFLKNEMGIKTKHDPFLLALSNRPEYEACWSEIFPHLKILAALGSPIALEKLKAGILNPHHALSALSHFCTRSAYEQFLNRHEMQMLDSLLLQKAESPSNDMLEMLHTYFKPNHLEDDDLTSQYVNFLINAVSKDKNYLIVLMDLANTEKKVVLRTLKTLASKGNPTAKLVSAHIEYENFLYRSSILTIQSTAFDAAFEKWLVIADLQTLRCEDFILYLLPPHLRLSWIESRPKKGCSLLQFDIYEIIENDTLHSAMVLRIADLLEQHPDQVVKVRIAKLIVDWIHIIQWNQHEVAPYIIKQLIAYPQLSIVLLSMMRSNTHLKKGLTIEEIHTLEQNAINKTLKSKYDENKTVLKYLLSRCRRDFAYYSPLYTSLIVHHVKHHSREWETLLHLAFCNVSEAIACLEEMARKNIPEAEMHYHTYQFMQWIKTHDLDILSDKKASTAALQDCTDTGCNFILSFFENPRRPANLLCDLFDRAHRSEEENAKKRALVILLGVQRFDFLIPSLGSIAFQGQQDALECLQKLAAANRGSAVIELARYDFKEFIRTCDLQTLRSKAFDNAIESAAAHELRLRDYALSIYLLPYDLRLCWQESITDPNQNIKDYLLDRNLETNFSMLQTIPQFIERLVDNIACKLSSSLPPTLLKHISLLIIDHQLDLGLHDEHPTFQKAIEILAALEVRGDKNPVRICSKLMQLKSQPTAFVPPSMSVENKMLSFDLPCIQNMLVSIPRFALHQDVTWSKWETLIKQIRTKLVDPAVAKSIQDATIGGWRSLYNTCLNDTVFFKPRIEFQGERVPLNIAQLNAILHKIFHLSDEGYPLSPKEQALITFGESVKNCAGGKFEGVALFYSNGLEPEYKFKHPIFNEPDPAKAKAKSLLADLFQQCISAQFSGTNHLMQELTTDPEVNQASHQSIYLKNLIGHIVGLQHDLHFDMNTGMLYSELLIRLREEVLEIFFKHFTPQTLVDHLHAWMIRDSEVPGRKNWDKIFSLVVPEEEDMLWDPNTDMPTEPTKIYARKILEATGYLKSVK